MNSLITQAYSRTSHKVIRNNRRALALLAREVGTLMLAALVLLATSKAGSLGTATTNAPTDQQWDATIVEIHQQAWMISPPGAPNSISVSN